VAGAGFRAAVLHLQKVIILAGSHSICGEHPQKFCHELGLDFVSRATDLSDFTQILTVRKIWTGAYAVPYREII
jgi:hypothetical protein